MKYIVDIAEVHITSVEVEASDPDDARKKAKDLNNHGKVNSDDCEFSHTLPSDDWEVFTEAEDGLMENVE